MVECWLPYGKTEVHITVPIRNLLGIAEVEAVIAEEPENEIINSIQEPIGPRGLTDLGSKGKRVAVALDGELPSPYIGLIAERVVKEFIDVGVKAEEISIVVSPGTFGNIRTDLRDQLKPLEKLNIKITQHSWSQGDTISIGKSERDKIFLNQEFVEADTRVLIGEVKPDPIAGYSGGVSILFPGLSEVRNIESSLRRSRDVEGRFSVLEGNPIYEDSRDVAGLVDVDFTVNIVSDPKGNLIRVFSGDLENSWRRAVELAEKTHTVPVENGGDVFVLSAGGYPYDRTLYRASMAMEGLSHLGRRESRIILLAECSEGVGDPSFYRYMAEYRDLKDMEGGLKERWALGGDLAYRLRRTLEGHQFVLVSMLPDNMVRPLDIKVRRTASDALRYVTRGAGRDMKVVVIPFGSVTILNPKA